MIDAPVDTSAEETPASARNAVIRLQNMLHIVEQLGMRHLVKLKVMRPAGEQDGQPRYLVIVHVAADHAFKAVLSRASAADMPLFRGMFLTIRLNKTAVAAPAPTDVAVHQAFLPKFENEAQDAHVADAIVEQAGARYMVATVKHSGSLATLSHDLVGAKNSVRNEFTAVAVVLLRAHYERLATQDSALDAGASVHALLERLREARLSVSFEVVARCLPDHGQRPQGEYLVVTSIARHCADGRIEVLPLHEVLAFCARHKLPSNDAWLVASKEAAARMRECLDHVASEGVPTAEAAAALDALVASSPGALHVPGAYPHAAWQGSRIEGFVVAQGPEISAEFTQEMRSICGTLQEQRLDAQRNEEQSTELLRPATALLGTAVASDDSGDAVRPVAADAVAAVQRHIPDLAHLLVRSPVLCCVPGAPEGRGDAALKAASPPTMFGLIADTSGALLPAMTASSLQGSWKPATEQESQRVQEAMRCGALDSAHKEHSDTAAAATLAQRRMLATVDAAERPAYAGGQGAICEALASTAGATDLQALSAAFQQAYAPLMRGTRLRYKKKMTGYRLPDPSGHPGAAPGHVAYCMLTFVIRNLLPELRRDAAAYLAATRRLATAWRLAPAAAARVQTFASLWAAWTAQHPGRLAAMTSRPYLDEAEAFVAAFLRGDVATGASGRAYYGTAVLAGFDEAFVLEVKRAVGAARLEGLSGGALSKGALDLPEGGLVVAISALDPPAASAGAVESLHRAWPARTAALRVQARPQKGAWDAAAEHVKIVVRPLPEFTHPPPKDGVSGSSKPSPVQCVLMGLQAHATAACEAVERHCAQAGVDVSERLLRLDEPAWLPEWIRRGKAPPEDGAPAADGASAAAASGADDGARLGSSTSLPHMEELAVVDNAPRGNGEASSSGVAVAAAPAGADAGAVAGARKKQKVHDAAARKRLRQQRGAGGRKLPEVVRSAPVATSREALGDAAHEAILQRVVAFLGSGVPRPGAKRPVLAVLFVGIPGLGKSTLCAALRQALQPAAEVAVHCADDVPAERKKAYWADAAKAAADAAARGGDAPFVLLADRNLLDSAHGNFQKVAGFFQAQGVPCLALYLSDTATTEALLATGHDGTVPPLPQDVTPELVALCVRRVLQRAPAAGPSGASSKLAADARDACRIVASFAKTYAMHTPRASLARLRDLFGHAAPLGVVRTAGHAEPPPQDVADLLARVRHGVEVSTGHGASKALDVGWEGAMRQALQNPSVARHLESLQVPVEDMQKGAAAAVHTALARAAEDRAAGGAPHAPARKVQYIAAAITGADREALAEAFVAAQHAAGAEDVREAKRELHVTLWHAAHAQRGDGSVTTRGAIEAHAREPVAIAVLGFDCGRRAAAARVELRGVAAAWRGERPWHVTMWHGSGVRAAEAGALREQCGEGGGTEVRFVPCEGGELVVRGTVELR